MNFKIEPGEVRFTIHINWPEADVDAVFAEIGGMFQGEHEVQTNSTPTAESVSRVLDDLMTNHREYWDSLKVECKESYGLMMGCCHVTFSTTFEDYTPDLVKHVKADVQHMMSKGVRYYKRKTSINGHRICSVITH